MVPFARKPHFSTSTSAEEERLAEAEVRLTQARVDALLGRAYNAEAFDRLVAEYRAAKRSADAARLAVQQASAATKRVPRALAATVALDSLAA